jgi:hypothetical protein
MLCNERRQRGLYRLHSKQCHIFLSFNTSLTSPGSSSSETNGSENPSDMSSISSDDSWSSILGGDWRDHLNDSDSMTSGSSDFFIDAELDSMPDLASLDGSDDEDSDDDSDESYGSLEWLREMFDSADSGADGDDEEDFQDESEDEESRRLGHHMRQSIRHLYEHRYKVLRDEMLRGPGYIYHVLDVLKPQRPDPQNIQQDSCQNH